MTEELSTRGAKNPDDLDTARSKKKKKKLIRPRGRRGGKKNHRPIAAEAEAAVKVSSVRAAKKKVDAQAKKRHTDVDSSDATPTEHSIRIARYHTLEKELARTPDPVTRAAILAEQEQLGGIDAYQNDSLTGGAKDRGGETGKWCAKTLSELRGRDKLRLLDVGALSGTSYTAYPWIDVTSIDINPRSDEVIRSDFFDFPIPTGTASEPKYDVVCLSLVINFIGDLSKRGEALLRAHRYLVPAGWMYLVLPLACVTNSRYLTHERLQAILESCGWDIRRQEDSARLTRWLCQRKQGPDRKSKRSKSDRSVQEWDGVVWKKEEVRVSKTANNFCIKVGPSGSGQPAKKVHSSRSD